MDLRELNCPATLKFPLQAHDPLAWVKMLAIWAKLREAEWWRYTEGEGGGGKVGLQSLVPAKSRSPGDCEHHHLVLVPKVGSARDASSLRLSGSDPMLGSPGGSGPTS